MPASPPDSAAAARGILFILSGPSGVGKNTVLQHALSRLHGIIPSVSVTTRLPRPNETHGADYFFVSLPEFLAMLERGELLEHAAVHGHLYGTPRNWVLEQLHAGRDIVLAIDVQGAVQVKSLFPQAILIFLAPPSWSELARRLHGRNTESDESIRQRLDNARAELAQAGRYEYLIINEQVNEAACRLRAIVTAERCRPWRQDLDLLLKEGQDDG